MRIPCKSAPKDAFCDADHVLAIASFIGLTHTYHQRRNVRALKQESTPHRPMLLPNEDTSSLARLLTWQALVGCSTSYLLHLQLGVK